MFTMITRAAETTITGSEICSSPFFSMRLMSSR